MKKLFYMQLKLLWTRLEFKLIFTTVLLIGLGSFVSNCNNFYGRDISYVVPANEAWIGESTVSSSFLGILFLTLPLLASIPYSESHLIDYKTGMSINILSRANRISYYFTQTIIVFISGFVVIFVPLFLNQILCLVAFPIDSEYSFMSGTSYTIDSFIDSIFPSIRMNNPYIHNLIYSIIPAVFSGLCALISYTLSFIIKRSKFLVVILSFLIINLYNFISAAVGFNNYSLLSNLYPLGVTNRTPEALLSLILIFFLGCLILIINKIYVLRDEL